MVAGRLLVLALAPALGEAFLPPVTPSFWSFAGAKQCSSAESGRTSGGLYMTRQGVQEKLEKVFLRNAILNKEKYGYAVVDEETEYEEGYMAPGQDDGPEKEVFSPLELKAMYGENYPGPFNQDEVQPTIGDFTMPAYMKGDIIKGIVVSSLSRVLGDRAASLLTAHLDLS